MVLTPVRETSGMKINNCSVHLTYSDPTPNTAETMTVEGTKTDNVMEEKKTELKEKKKDEEGKQFNFSQKPEVKHGWEGFLNFFWNPETGEFLGRTGMSWCKSNFTRKIYSIRKYI